METLCFRDLFLKDTFLFTSNARNSMLTGCSSIVHSMHSLVPSLRGQFQTFVTATSQFIHGKNSYNAINSNAILIGTKIANINCNIGIFIRCSFLIHEQNNVTNQLSNFDGTHYNEFADTFVNDNVVQQNNIKQ